MRFESLVNPKKDEPTDLEVYEGVEREHPEPPAEFESYEGNAYDPDHTEH